MTRGGVPSLKALYDQGYSSRAQWLEVYVREAHPGENYPAPQTYEEKMAHARDFKRLEELPWPVLVDDLAGTVHRAYGELPNSAYVIDANGRVAFKDQWASALTIRQALDALWDEGGRAAPVLGGVERMLHMLGPMAFGWPAIQRAGDRAIQEIWSTIPPLAMMLSLGHQMQPVIGPMAKRTWPIPTSVKVGALVALGSLLAFRFLRR